VNGKILGLGLTLAALTASAQEQTYDFTGTVTDSSVNSVVAGMTVSGTYTVNIANTDTSAFDGNDEGAIGPGPWLRATDGGAFYHNTPVPTGTVFSSTVTVGFATYGNAAPSALGSASEVRGGTNVGNFYGADDTEFTSPSSFVESELFINDTAKAPFALTGLPLFGATSSGTGSLLFASNATDTDGFSYTSTQIDYSLTSFTVQKAPEIGAAGMASGLTLLLGGLVVLCGRRGASLGAARLG
jgi:hypothetical protein